MKQLILYLLLFCSCALNAQEQKYIFLDSLTANFKVKQYTLDTSPYGVKNTIEVYNVFSKNYGKDLDSDFIVLFSVLPDLESKNSWQEIPFDMLQKKYMPAKKLFDRIYRKTYEIDSKKDDNTTLSLVKKVKNKYFVAKNCRINEFFCTNIPSEMSVATGRYIIDTNQATMPVSVLKSLYKKRYPNEVFPLDDKHWIVPKYLEHIYLENVEEKEGDTIYYFYLYATYFVESFDKFAYIKDRGIVAASYYEFFFPIGCKTPISGDWIKLRTPYKKELFWAEELKKEWAEKEKAWKKEREREEKEFNRL